MNYPEIDLGELDVIKINYKIGGRLFTLQEADAAGICRYKDTLMSRTKLGPDGKPVSYQNMAKTDLLLVSLCLSERYAESPNQPRQVTQDELEKWPNRITTQLYDKCREICGLADEEEDEAFLSKEIGRLQGKLDEIKSPQNSSKNGEAAGRDSSA